jgi:hypothetical protein
VLHGSDGDNGPRATFRTRGPRGLVALCLLILAATAWGEPATAAVERFSGSTLLVLTPTADVLPPGSFALSADFTYPIVKTRNNLNYPEADASIRFSPFERFDFALTAYTFSDYVLDARYRILDGGPDRLGVALGVYDVGLHSYVSSVGHDTANTWPDWKYNEYLPRYDRQTERFSAFAVASIPVADLARIHVGLGRGRFVGYDAHSKYFNTDIFFREYHKWAVALFGGVEVHLTPQVALVAEATSRDFNAGVKAKFGPVGVNLAWTKVEGLLFADGGDRFGRVELGATFEFGSGLRPLPSAVPERLHELPPPPETTQPAVTEIQPPAPPETTPPAVVKLEPIWFLWDRSEITLAAAATLRANADAILSQPGIKTVSILGYASEEGSLEHNLPLSQRRAKVALEFLESLGVPADILRAQGMGESPGRPLHIHRVDYFEVETK